MQAFFSSDDTTAYVVNCGAECGGVQASVQQLEMTTNAWLRWRGLCHVRPSASCAATVASLMARPCISPVRPTCRSYRQPLVTCKARRRAADLRNAYHLRPDEHDRVYRARPSITDGYHNRIAIGPNGQLFIGARTCTEIIPPVSAAARRRDFAVASPSTTL